MKSGKVSEAVLKRSVIKTVNKQKNEWMLSKAGVGCDAGLFAVPETSQVLASACTSLAGNEEGLGGLAVVRACNSLAATGALPLIVTVQLILPETMEESGLKQTMQEVLEACAECNVALSQGHTQVSSFVTERVVSVTAVGTAPEAQMLSETVYGSDLVMVKTAGLAGAALLAKHYRENLHERYTYSFIDRAVARQPECSVLSECNELWKLGVRHMHDVAEGGVFGAVWEFAERLGAGMELDLKKIPILQETVEISEYFDINPYQMKGDGALLFLSLESEAVIAALAEKGIGAKVIGKVTDSNDRVLINEEEVRFLEPNRVDEYEKARQTKRMVTGE